MIKKNLKNTKCQFKTGKKFKSGIVRVRKLQSSGSQSLSILNFCICTCRYCRI